MLHEAIDDDGKPSGRDVDLSCASRKKGQGGDVADERMLERLLSVLPGP